MDFLIEPFDLTKELSDLTDQNLLQVTGCSNGSGCCSGSVNKDRDILD